MKDNMTSADGNASMEENIRMMEQFIRKKKEFNLMVYKAKQKKKYYASKSKEAKSRRRNPILQQAG